MTDAPDVVVDWVEGYTFLGSDDSGHSIAFDSSKKGVSRGFSPMKALLASLGACSGMDVVAILGKRKQRLTSLKVSISGLRPEYGLPKPYTSISIKYLLTGKELQKEHVDEAVRGSIERYCSVAATVNSRAKIEYSYEIAEG
ncbi:MAG: OsmC family protein [Thaumarchaeota archaeon]|nr:OsmC family protein [Nitrososphaerota archaeon]